MSSLSFSSIWNMSLLFSVPFKIFFIITVYQNLFIICLSVVLLVLLVLGVCYAFYFMNSLISNVSNYQWPVATVLDSAELDDNSKAAAYIAIRVITNNYVTWLWRFSSLLCSRPYSKYFSCNKSFKLHKILVYFLKVVGSIWVQSRTQKPS